MRIDPYPAFFDNILFTQMIYSRLSPVYVAGDVTVGVCGKVTTTNFSVGVHHLLVGAKVARGVSV